MESPIAPFVVKALWPLWLLCGASLTIGSLAQAQPVPNGANPVALKVFACEPEWAALVQELAGPHAEVTTATTAMQDPHHVQARPSLVARMRQAQFLACTGAELETGWLPVLLEQASNAKVLPGAHGHFMAAEHVQRLEVPDAKERAAGGDVHAMGNPHVQTDPRRMLTIARAMAARLAMVDASRSAQYRQALASFEQRWQAAMGRWEQRAAPLKGMAVVSQHKAFAYLYEWLGLVEVAVLEPRPGVEPTVAHLNQVLARLRANPARMVLVAAYQDARPTQWLANQNLNPPVSMVKVPFTVGGSEAAKDLFSLFDDTVARLLQALAPPPSPPDGAKP